MAASGPMGYTARPEAMGALISTLFADRLFEHGIPYLRVGLMTVYVEERATAELASMKRCPADEAMTMHGMFRRTIDECQRQVRLELEEIVDEHITLVQQATEAGVHGTHPRVEPGQTDSGRHELLPAQMRTLGTDPIPHRSGPP
jgi:hypothetical protein